MKISNIKRLKWIIFILLIVCTVSLGTVSLVNVFAIINPNPEQVIVPGEGGATEFSGGRGTESSPYQIWNSNDLIDLQNYVNEETKNDSGIYYSACYYKVMTNISLSGADFTGIGEVASSHGEKGEAPKQYFKKFFCGVFDGNGHTISGISISSDFYGILQGYVTPQATLGESDISSGGFFSALNGATIKNLKLDDISIYLTNRSLFIDNFMTVGAITGYANGDSVIENCQVSNFHIYAYWSEHRDYDYQYHGKIMGGILGYGDDYNDFNGKQQPGVAINNCEVQQMEIDFDYVDSTSNSGRKDYVGAIAGYIYYGSISKSVAHVEGGGFSCDYTDMPSKNNTNQAIGGCYSGSVDAIINKNKTGSLNYSYSGGSSGTIWYYHESYDYYPTLRTFINWTTLTFTSDTNQGTVSTSSIQYPSDYSPSISTGDATIGILGQTVTATGDTGYEFDYWDKSGSTYTAYFKKKTLSLQFGEATGVESGDTISPSITGEYTVYYGTDVTISLSEDKSTLTYTFEDINKTTYNVTYTITEKYNLTSASSGTETVKLGSVIRPTVSVKTYTVSLLNADNADRTEKIIDDTFIAMAVLNSKFTVKHGEKVNVTAMASSSPNYVIFSYDKTYVTYTAKDNCTYGYIKVNNETDKLSKLENVTENLIITPVFIKWYDVTFAKVDNASLTTSFTESSIKVSSDDNIITATLSRDNKTLVYSNNGNTATYVANKYYTMAGNKSITISGDDIQQTIYPDVPNNACEITFGKTDDDLKYTMTVTGDNYGTTVNDGIFKVEYGTTVKFEISSSNGIFTYTYTFSSGEIVTYTTTNDNYAMQYLLDDSTGDRTKIYNGLNGTGGIEDTNDKGEFKKDTYQFSSGTSGSSKKNNSNLWQKTI